MGVQYIGKLKSSIEKSPTLKSYFSAAHRGVGNEPVENTKRATCLSRYTIETFIKAISTTDQFHPLPHVKIPLPQAGFPSPKSFVRGHGRCRSSHPRPPWPWWAARGPTRGPSQLRSAAVFCLGKPRPHGPSPANRTQRNGRGEKLWENFGTSKVEVLEIVDIPTPH